MVSGGPDYRVLGRWVIFGLVGGAALALSLAPAIAGRFNVDLAIAGTSFVLYAAVGGLIIARRDGHLTGWLLLMTGFSVVIGNGFSALPGVSQNLAVWVESWVWTAVFALFALLTLTFPSGRLPEGGGVFARLGRGAVWALPVLWFLTAFTENMGGPEAASDTPNPLGFLPAWMGYPGLFAVILIFLGGALSLEVRRRRARGTERAQLAWVVFALLLLVTTVVLTVLFVFGSIALGFEDPGDDAWFAAFSMMILMPIAFGVAVLRYRLFEIDRIVSRTVSWAMLSAVVAGLYLVSVFVLRSLLPATGDLAVAASTLAVAVIFNPLRRALQGWVDRRFNRARFDAAKAIEGMSAQLRSSAANLLQVRGGVEEIVRASMQPTTVAVWIRRP